MIKILTATDKKALNAGPKAKLDIVTILKNVYGKEIKEETVNIIDKSKEGKKNNIFNKFYNFLSAFKLIIKNINYKGIIIIQYPFIKNIFIRLLPKKKTIIIIHDLTGIRNLDFKLEKEEIKTLKKFRYIIVHNKRMHEYLKNNGVESDIVELQLFDYLCTENCNKEIEEHNFLNVAYVGNLKETKTPFIYQLDDKMNYYLNLYGNGIEKEKIKNNKIVYHGAFQPDELPNIINSDIGLVWDGKIDELDESEGVKNYTKYNNPHKLSCYIAANIPVIVWSKSAIADFVKKNELGYCINNLNEINNINLKDIESKKKNLKEISDKVKNGYYIINAIEKIVNKIEEEEYK